jgi:hypothetical protein
MSDDIQNLLHQVWPTLSLAERQALRIIIKSMGRRGPAPGLAAERPSSPLPHLPGAVPYGRVMDRIDEDALVEALHQGRGNPVTPREGAA